MDNKPLKVITDVILRFILSSNDVMLIITDDHYFDMSFEKHGLFVL